MKLLAEVVGEHHHGVADLHQHVHQFAAWSRRPADFLCLEGLLQEIAVFGGAVDVQVNRDGVEAGRNRADGIRHEHRISTAV